MKKCGLCGEPMPGEATGSLRLMDAVLDLKAAGAKGRVMTNREAHEEAAGMNLDNIFFACLGIDPDAEYFEEEEK